MFFVFGRKSLRFPSGVQEGSYKWVCKGIDDGIYKGICKGATQESIKGSIRALCPFGVS